jgi:hypothetical protein
VPARAGAWPQQPLWAAWLAAAGLPQQAVAAAAGSVPCPATWDDWPAEEGEPQQPPAAGGVKASARSPRKPPLVWFVIVFSLLSRVERPPQP